MMCSEVGTYDCGGGGEVDVVIRVDFPLLEVWRGEWCYEGRLWTKREALIFVGRGCRWYASAEISGLLADLIITVFLCCAPLFRTYCGAASWFPTIASW